MFQLPEFCIVIDKGNENSNLQRKNRMFRNQKYITKGAAESKISCASIIYMGAYCKVIEPALFASFQILFF